MRIVYSMKPKFGSVKTIIEIDMNGEGNEKESKSRFT